MLPKEIQGLTLGQRQSGDVRMNLSADRQADVSKVLVLGGYGLIGSACMRALANANFKVAGVGRSYATALRLFPNINWTICDISKVSVDKWRGIFDDFDVIVNASGALQDGGQDNVYAIHETAVERIVAALENTQKRLVHISAAGVSEQASTDFYKSKACGERIIRESNIDWIIFRPGLVIGHDAYGGSALLRAAAAIPFVAVNVLPNSKIQTVYVEDLAEAVVLAANGSIASQVCAELLEKESRSLPETLSTLRQWLGVPEPKIQIPIPMPVLSFVSILADFAGHLGWRSPLRSNAIRALRDGIEGDVSNWLSAGGNRCRNLDESLSSMPATVQERWFARLYFAFPVSVLLLSVFWVLSGTIGLAHFGAAKEVLTSRGIDKQFATIAVAGGAVLDIGLGLTVLWRRWTSFACIGMMIISVAYLIGGTFLTPDIWADPLGAFVKILPGIGLALITAVLSVNR